MATVITDTLGSEDAAFEDGDNVINQLTSARRRAEERLAKLRAEVAALEEALGYPRTRPAKTAPSVPAPSARKTRIDPNLSMPKLVVAILEQHPEGLTALEVIREAVAVNGKIEPKNIHSALRAPGIRKEGERRSYRYFAEVADE